jgi:hypothetical protein
MCTVLLPLGGYPIAVDKYITSNRVQGMDRIHLAQDMVQWLVLANMVVDLQVQ